GLWAQLRVEETGGGLRAPSDSVFLSCRASSFDYGYYALWWYRLAPGARLEWVSYIDYGSEVIKFARSVEGRAMASWEYSQSELSISLHALNTQDSAHYFCAVSTQ
ncbi:HV348 protein, partial [Crotophaga sulcirostris]|nr:HV348 protein [Crotophaga sulcirostris]